MDRFIRRVLRRAQHEYAVLRRRWGRRLSPQMRSLAQTWGRRNGVSGAIHPDDFMFWAIHDDPARTDKLSAVDAYFESGRVTALELRAMLAPHLGPGPVKVLDFASGYARVSRHFTASWPEATVSLSDIHAKACRFNRGLGFAVARSTWTPETFRPGQFDAVMTVSFFTHIPRDVFVRWLAALGGCLRPGGVLLFTTHGNAALKSMAVSEVPEDGFFFKRTSEQRDLSTKRYGETVSLPSFVRSAISEAGLDLVECREPGLGWQDLYIVRRGRA